MANYRIAIEMPLDEVRYERLSAYTRLQQMNGSKYDGLHKDYVTFSSCGINFILIHGSKDGLVQFRGHLITPQQLLHLIKPSMVKQGIKEVKTLSCFGGAQVAAEEDGYKISSFHTSHKEIFHMMTMDGIEFTFDFTEEEVNLMDDLPDDMEGYRIS